jgi:PHD/YefM family antitoxin component YafN of YafNO toxin-antitoxin module
MATPIATSDIRSNWADVVNRAQYAGERFLVQRHNDDVAGIVSPEDVRMLEEISDWAGAGEALSALDETSSTGSMGSFGKERKLESLVSELSSEIASSGRDSLRALTEVVSALILKSSFDPGGVFMGVASMYEQSERDDRSSPSEDRQLSGYMS